jgi:pimeloyl-ACP methyl ester carboxylesterase
MVTTNIYNTLNSIKQAVTDLRALIHYLKTKNQKVILIGMSLGGFITNLAAAVEEKIDVLISVMYANSLPFSVWKSIPGKYLKQDFEANGYTYEKLKEFWAIMVPSNFKPVVAKERILLISGIHDRYVLLEDTDLLWQAWDKPKRILLRCGHSGIVFCKNDIRKATLDFLKEVL